MNRTRKLQGGGAGGGSSFSMKGLDIEMGENFHFMLIR